MDDKAIEIKNLYFRYANTARVIFADFNWSVNKGDFWVLVGANGSGKTSLIRLLLGLEYPETGTISILGNNLSKASCLFIGSRERAIRAQISHVPQYLQFDRRLPISVLDVVEGGTLSYSFWQGLRRGPTAKQRQEICLQSLAQVGLESLAKERFSVLSGGQKQRALIARALAARSPILILDEPTASVDPTAAREIVHICQKLRKQHTILFVSHDISVIPSVCEHILCINPSGDPSVQVPSSVGAIVHSHDVRGMSRAEILFLLYSHWGLTNDNAQILVPSHRQHKTETPRVDII